VRYSYRAFRRLQRLATRAREEIRRISTRTNDMITPSEYPSSNPFPDDIEIACGGTDFIFPLQPLNEAIDVAFLAVRAAQQAARDVPASASAAEFRDEWHTSNILVRQALRLVDERAQKLNKYIKRLPRLG
jgi:hypothetical protein